MERKIQELSQIIYNERNEKNQLLQENLQLKKSSSLVDDASFTQDTKL